MNMTFLLIFSLISTCIELEISAPGFPEMIIQLSVSETMVGLTITCNLVGFCLASLVYGPLSECYGRRRIMLVGNGIFALGAIGCVLSPSIEWILISRFVQGLGAATSAVMVSTIIGDLYTADKAAKIYGLLNAALTTFMAIAPVLGGFINAAVGWRGNYGIVAFICVVSWLLLVFKLPETKHTREPLKISLIIQNYKNIFSSGLFIIATIVPSLIYGAYMTFVAIAPFIYMQVFNLSILDYTLHQALVVAGFSITSVFSGGITDKLGVKRTIWISLNAAAIAAIMMLFAKTPYGLTLPMTLFCIATALLYPIIFAHSMEIFPDLKGTASSAIMSLRYLLCSVITAIASYVYDETPVTLAIVICVVTGIICLLSVQLLYKIKFEK